MKINLNKLNFSFSQKPLVIGGKAMEYYGLRKSRRDIDLVVAKKDFKKLVVKYKNKLKNLGGDFGVCPYKFEIWKTIRWFDYKFLSEKAIEKENYLIISLEKLLLLKAMAMKETKYLEDLKLIVEKITIDQYKKSKQIKTENEEIIKNLENVKYVEKKG